jgi:DNA-binding NarL/FixJ family response regulator
VVVLSEEKHPNLPVAFHNGADAFILKTLPADTFFHALAQVLGGESALTPGMAAQMLTEFRQQEAGLPHLKSLTPRQQEILGYIAQGMTYDEIADQLHLSARTVRYHVVEIRRRLGLANRNEVARYARRHHLGEG